MKHLSCLIAVAYSHIHFALQSWSRGQVGEETRSHFQKEPMRVLLHLPIIEDYNRGKAAQSCYPTVTAIKYQESCLTQIPTIEYYLLFISTVMTIPGDYLPHSLAFHPH